MHEPFGKYTLIDWLAAGGMGEVFLAKAGPEGFVRLFAIKRILAQHAESDDFVRMMKNEARISILLNHPNIAQVFEFGQIGRHFFLALEYVEGLSLVSLLRRGRDRDVRITAADAVSVAVQVSRALHYAHTKADNSGKPLDIVHRDISPHNVLLDETGAVKVIDFGIARASESLVKTDADSIKGKIPYMSPEQAKGEPIDGRSDLYALGVVLYEALTYEPMHRSRNTFETLRDVQAGTVPPLELKLGPGTPKSLIAVLERTLQRDPAHRFSSAAEMERALALVLHELEPGYTTQRLAGIIKELDQTRAERKALIKTSVTSLRGAAQAADAAPVSAAGTPGTPVSATGDEAIEIDVTAARSRSGGAVPDTSGEEVPTRVVKPRPTTGDVVVPASVAAPAAARRSRWWLGAAAGGGAALLVALVVLIATQLAPPAPAGAAPTAPAGAPAGAPGVPAAAATRAVLVQSDPPGAVITIDGRWRGQTPAELHVPRDAAVDVRLELAGHVPAQLTLPLGSTEPAIVTLVRAAAPPISTPTSKLSDRPHGRRTSSSSDAAPAEGCVAIAVSPWAHVSVGGKRVGTTPIPCLKLAAGRHTLHLENPALDIRRDVEVTVPAGGTVKVSQQW